jgi:predicted small lipoprotein YifL
MTEATSATHRAFGPNQRLGRRAPIALRFLAVLFVSLLAGCGMKGDLTRPAPETPRAAESSA